MPVRMFQTSRLAAEVKTYYTPEHEWIRYDDATNEGVLGITDHAQNSLGDVVYLELPEKQQEVSRGGAYPTLTGRPDRRYRVGA